MKIQGAVALITGAAEGFGKAFAEELLKKSARGVSIVDFNAEKGQATKEEFTEKYGKDSAMFIHCDVTSKAQLEDAFAKTVQHYNGLDIVCNNAGIGDEENWERTIDVDLVAVIRGTYLAGKYMDKNGDGKGGVVVNIASMAAFYPMPYISAYSAAKHGVLGFTRSCGMANVVFNAGNVRLNCLCPSFSDTAILQELYKAIEKNPVVKRVYGTKLTTIPVSMVAEGFMQLVEDDAHHGKVMRCTPKKGIDFKEFIDVSQL